MTTDATRSWRDWSCLVRVTLDGGRRPDLTLAVHEVRRLMAEVELAVSRFRDDSDLARVNAGAGTLVPVGRLTVRLVDVALAAARDTAGAVDPTVGGAVLAAGYTRDIADIRPRASVRPGSARRASWRSVVLERDLDLIGVPAGVRLDLGATAKAWTVDEAARRVHARLGLPVLVEIGGDLAVAGSASRPWRIDVAEIGGGPTYRVELTHGGLATSSVLARSWESIRGREHHLIDPASGRPTDGAVRSATVWAPTALAANTWSTAAIVWGDAASARLRAAGVDARLVDRTGAVVALGAWPADLAVVDGVVA